MITTNKKSILTLLLWCVSILTATAQQEDVTVESGQFTADWQSLSAWECPEWFRDATLRAGIVDEAEYYI